MLYSSPLISYFFSKRYWIYAEIRSKDKNRDAKENSNEDESNIATSELPVEVYSACSIPIEELRVRHLGNPNRKSDLF